jgi:hypothetical protein
VTKVAVITIDNRPFLRKGFENRFVSQLGNGSTPAFATHGMLSLGEIKQDKQAAAKRFQEAGADAVLILRLVDVSTSYREVRPGNDRWTETITGYGNYGWYDYFEVGYMDMSPTYGSVTARVYLETGLYELNTGKRIWAGLSETVLHETADRVAEMDPLVGRIVDSMRKDGVVR